MLLYHPRLNRDCLRQLAALLAASGKIRREETAAAIDATVARLGGHFGKTGA